MKTLSYAATFVLDEQRRLLCVKELYESDGQYHWTVPGGGIDAGETPKQAAQRETREEAGVQLSGDPLRLYEITIRFPDALVKAYGIYYPHYAGDLQPLDPEIAEAAFLPLAEVREHLAKIGSPKRTDPILAVLGGIEAGQMPPFFHWEYQADADNKVIDKKIIS